MITSNRSIEGQSEPVLIPIANSDLDASSLGGMQFTVESSALLSALTLSMKSVWQSRYGPSILKHVQIEARGTSVMVSTSNLDTTISLTLLAQVEHEGTFTVPAKMLLDCVKTFPKQQIVEIQVETGLLRVACGSRSFALKDGTDGDDFPMISLPEMEGQLDEVVIESRNLQRAISSVAFAASKDEQRPTLMGVCLHMLPDTVKIVAIDNAQMALATLPNASVVDGRDVQVLIPATSIRCLSSILPDTHVVITWDRKRAAFQAGNVTFTCRLIDGRFPDYAAPLRISHTSTFTLKRQDLVSLLQGIHPLFQGFSKVKVLVSYATGSGVAFHAESSTGELNDKFQTEVVGEDGQVVLNACQLSEMLDVVKDRAFTFHLSGMGDPVVLVPVGRSDYHYVSMPME